MVVVDGCAQVPLTRSATRRAAEAEREAAEAEKEDAERRKEAVEAEEEAETAMETELDRSIRVEEDEFLRSILSGDQTIMERPKAWWPGEWSVEGLM